jgi:hypothetical protein
MEAVATKQTHGFQRGNRLTPKRTQASLDKAAQTRKVNRLASVLIERSAEEIACMARSATAPAIDFLLEVLADKEAERSDKLEAAKVLMSRGWGDAARFGAVALIDTGNSHGITITKEAILAAARRALLTDEIVDALPTKCSE